MFLTEQHCLEANHFTDKNKMRKQKNVSTFFFLFSKKNQSDLFLAVQLVMETRHVTGAGVGCTQQLDEETQNTSRINEIRHTHF